MAENMFCDGQKILSSKGKKNWDKIFKKEGHGNGRKKETSKTKDK